MDSVLIVGAGPTGLMLAIELQRRGVPHTLIDQRPEPLLWDRAAVVKSRTLEIFDALGLAQQFHGRGTRVRGVDFYSRGARKASMRLGDLDTPFPYTLGLSEGVTEQILTAELERLGGRVERGVEFVESQANDEAVRVTVRESGAERTFRAGWLVGADGLHSKVREAAGVEFAGHDYESNGGSSTRG